MESPILTYRPLRQLLKTDSYGAGHLCTCYIPMKFSNYPECRYVIAHLTSGAISKHDAVSGDCLSEQQVFSCFKFVSSNFYWPHILKWKADEMHLKNHLLGRRRFSRFSDWIWHETWFGKWCNCIAPHSCCCESPGVNTEFAVHCGKSTKILIQKPERDGWRWGG